jgi:uncharacterized protein
MPIIPAGTLNTSALVVPNLYVQIQPPQPVLNGVPSNIIGICGGASWGPLNVPSAVGSYAEYQGVFGPVLNATYDMGTQVAIAYQQGATSFVCNRVSDGTDVKATATIESTDATATALYSGTTGNNISIILGPGGQASSWNASIILPGVLSELFTNITGSGATFWTNLASAINNGQNPFRPASKLITLTAGGGVTAPVASTTTLSGGTNGMSGLNSATILGTNGIPRTGMYNLNARQGISIMLPADFTDETQWLTTANYCQSIGAYPVLPIAAGTSIAAAVSAIQTLGVNANSWLKIMHGDWLYWYDQVNGLNRVVNPAAFVAGQLGSQDPSQSTLNKPLNGIIGSQTAGIVGTPQQYTYSNADLSTLFSAGIDVISLPSPGGNYWSVLGGINANLNQAQNGDNYTTLTNYIASTLNAGMGQFVGMKITATMDQEATSTLGSFLSTLQQQGLLGDPTQPPPFTVIGGLGPGTINPQSSTQLGLYTNNVAVTYSPINRFFIVNLQGGQTVVTSSPLNL